MGRDMCTSQDFVNWVCGPRLDQYYLMHSLIMSRDRLRALSTGSTHKTIYFPTVEQFRILVPPLELQRAFARRVNTISVVTRINDSSYSLMTDLFASLQHGAFNGTL